MLALLFNIGEERYALDCASIVEIVPSIPARPIPGSPAWIRGVIDYRGSVTPVVDLKCALDGRTSEQFMSTRIVIANYPAASGSRPLGLVAERVLDTARLEEVSARASGVRSETAPWLGAVMKSGGDIVLCVDVRKLLPAEIGQWLFRD